MESESSAAAAECPHGHRPLELADIVAGLEVVYISRDTRNAPIATTIQSTEVIDNAIILEHKRPALLDRIFLPMPAVGGRDASAVEDAGNKEAEEFLQHILVPWMSNLESDASANGVSLPDMLAKSLGPFGGTSDELVQAFKMRVPWVSSGQVNFQVVPKSSKKGHIHISMLSHQRESYAANGLFLHDARLLVAAEGLVGLQQKTISVRPRPGAKMTCFGWEADGAVVNSTYAFLCSCIAAWAVINEQGLPQPLAHLLQHISVIFTKHESNEKRLLQNMVESAVQRHANRTVQCPIFLAEELQRCTFQVPYVKAFVRLYQQRMSVTPAFQMPQRMAECVIRLMTPNKTCVEANKVLADSVVRYTWDKGPWNLNHIMSPYFTMGASLNSSLVEQWASMNIQTASGQTMALHIGEEIFAKTGKRLDPEDEWAVVLVSCGLWVHAKEKMMPSLMMGEAAVGALEDALRTEDSFRRDLAQASAKDPPIAQSAVGDLANWLLNNVSALRRAKEMSVEAAKSGGDGHPGKLLGDAQAKELAAFNYTSSCMLDVEAYSEAMKKCGEEAEAVEEQWKELRLKYVSNLSRLHITMQQSDVVFWEPAQRVGVKKNKNWIANAVSACVAHRRNLKTILGVRDADICQVNVFSLHTLGTVKKSTLDAIAASLPQLFGLSILFYPVIPKRLKRTDRGAGVAVDAAGDAQASGSDSDTDADEHDCTADGGLPEALTSMHAVMTASERAAQLAADCHEVEKVVGMCDVRSRYPKYLRFLHTSDGAAGERSTTMAMMLVPTHEAPGINLSRMSESVSLRSGSFLEVPLPLPSEWISVSKKIAIQARRAMADNGQVDLVSTAAVGAGVSSRYLANKVSRGQLGTALHEVWIHDLIKACGVKVLYICDFAHGVGEVAKAAVSAKASVQASTAGVRVCLWAQDPRKVLAEIGKCVARTELSKLYSAKKLVIPGHEPMPDPGPRPEKTRKMLKALLPQPLKCLSIDPEGHLLFPTDDEISHACPVPLNEESFRLFASWREDFAFVPPPNASTPALTPTPGTDPASTPTPAPGTNRAPGPEVAVGTITPGTKAQDKDMLKKEFGDEIVSEKPLASECGVAAASAIKLVLTKKEAADGAAITRVWLHNTAKNNLSLPVAACVGQGGQGSFISLVSNSIDSAKLAFSWRYTRITGYKKDNAELANGFMVFNKAGLPLQGKPKLSCLHDIEREIGNNLTLYGHAITRGGAKVTITPSPSPVAWVPSMPAVGGDSNGPDPAAFSASTLGQYLCSHEDVSGGVPKCIGLLRPVFEVRPAPAQQSGSSGGASAYVLQPGAAVGRSALWLFTAKRIEIAGGGFVALG